MAQADIVLKVRGDTRGAQDVQAAVRRIRDDVEAIRRDAARPVRLNIAVDDQALGRARAQLDALAKQAARQAATAPAAPRTPVQPASAPAATANNAAAVAAARAAREVQRLADSEIRAARASGDHAKALALIDRELATASQGTVRYNNLLAQKATAEQRAAREAERAARAQAQASKQSAAGPVLPRSIAGVTADGVRGLVSAGIAFAGVSSAADLTTQAVQSFVEAYRFKAELDATSASIRAQVGGLRDFARVQAEAAQFGERFKFTQAETNAALAASVPILRSSNQSADGILTTLARLAVLNPAEGIQGAAFALRELQSGDVTSFVERFNQSRTAAYGLRDAIKSGADPIQALSKYLDDAGVSMAALEAQAQGAAGQLKEVARAQEELKLAQAELAAGPVVAVTDVQAAAARGLARLFRGELIPSLDEIRSKSEALQSILAEPAIAALPPTERQVAALIRLANVQGVTAQQAQASAQAQAQAGAQLATVADAINLLGVETTTTQTELQRLQATLNGLQQGGGAAGATAIALATAYNTGRISADQFLKGIQQLQTAQDAQGLAAQRAGERTAGAADQTKALAAAQTAIAGLGSQVAAGLTTSADAALILAQRYGLAYGEALKLIDAQARLGAARADQITAQGRQTRDLTGGRGAVTGAPGRQGNDVNDFLKFLDDQKRAEEARADQLRLTGTTAQQTAQAEKDLADARKKFGRDSAEAIEAETRLIQLRQQANNAGGSRRTAEIKDAQDLVRLENELRNKIDDRRKALLDVEIARRQESITQRQENQRLDNARRVLADSGTSAEQKAQAQDVLALVPLERQRRELDIKQQAREAQQGVNVSFQAGAVQVLVDGKPVEARIVTNFRGAVAAARSQG